MTKLTTINFRGTQLTLSDIGKITYGSIERIQGDFHAKEIYVEIKGHKYGVTHLELKNILKFKQQ